MTGSPEGRARREEPAAPAAPRGSRAAGERAPRGFAEARVVVPNPEGMHARPSHAFVTLASRFQSPLTVACGGREVNGRSIIELMTLAASCGDELVLRAQGPDAEELVNTLAAFVASGFRSEDGTAG